MNAKNKSDEAMVSWLSLNIVNSLFSSYWQMASDLNNLQNTKQMYFFPLVEYRSICLHM